MSMHYVYAGLHADRVIQIAAQRATAADVKEYLTATREDIRNVNGPVRKLAWPTAQGIGDAPFVSSGAETYELRRLDVSCRENQHMGMGSR